MPRLAIPLAGSERQSRAIHTECRRLLRLRGRIPALFARGPCSALRRHIPTLRVGPRAGWLARLFVRYSVRDVAAGDVLGCRVDVRALIVEKDVGAEGAKEFTFV